MAVGFFAVLVPVFHCPDCALATRPQVNRPPAGRPNDDPVIFFFPESKESLPPSQRSPPPLPPAPAPVPLKCYRCDDSRRITLWRRWFRKDWDWDGSVVSVRALRGLTKTNRDEVWGLTGIQLGLPVTRKIVMEAKAALLKTGYFDDVRIEVVKYPDTPGRVKVLIVFVEKTP